MAAASVYLPDIFSNFPWKREVNQHHDSVSVECRDWLHGFNMFDPRSTQAFDRCDSPLLASLAFPYHNAEQLRTDQDLMGLLYVFDEYTDVEDPESTRRLADLVMDALRNPDKERPAGEVAVGEFVRQYQLRARKVSTDMAVRHFIDAMQLYADGVVREVHDRKDRKVHTIQEYLRLRVHTSGCLPSFALVELELDFPEEVYRSDYLEKMRELAMSSIFHANDIYSYGVERAKGLELHNLVTIAMHEHDTGPQEAVDFICARREQLLADFIDLSAKAPSWGDDIDEQVRYYVNGLGCWIRGNDDWSFESERYFGTAAEQIRRTRTITMLPRADGTTVRPTDFFGGAALGIQPSNKTVK